MQGGFKEVRCEGVSKHFGTTVALDDVDLSFAAGSVTAVRGANGSGKTTLLSVLAQLTRPSDGVVRYGSLSGSEAARARSKISLLAHQPLLYLGLSADENLSLHAKLHGLDYATKRIEDLALQLGFHSFRAQPLRTCSRGQVQRIALARALLHEPSLFLLDEPTTGLDDTGTTALVETLDAQRQLGAIVVVVTHDERFATRVASREVVLKNGRAHEVQA